MIASTFAVTGLKYKPSIVLHARPQQFGCRYFKYYESKNVTISCSVTSVPRGPSLYRRRILPFLFTVNRLPSPAGEVRIYNDERDDKTIFRVTGLTERREDSWIFFLSRSHSPMRERQLWDRREFSKSSEGLRFIHRFHQFWIATAVISIAILPGSYRFTSITSSFFRFAFPGSEGPNKRKAGVFYLVWKKSARRVSVSLCCQLAARRIFAAQLLASPARVGK